MVRASIPQKSKVDFLHKNINLWRLAYSSNLPSIYSKELCRLARIELGYSKKTVDNDMLIAFRNACGHC